jgi:DNA adenine methylase
MLTAHSAKAPPIKTQGIKTKLVAHIGESVSWQGLGRWVEPFLGSGSVLLNVAPTRAIAADTNEHIIRFYQAIQSGDLTAARVREYLQREGRRLSESDGAHYYDVRDRFNRLGSSYDFLFLNRACFNGVMRFNSRGGFNVPFCKKPDRFAPALVTKICNQVAWAARVIRDRDWLFRVADWRDVDALALQIKALPAGFAYSTWKQNKYRHNHHLDEHFANYPIVTTEHFYHVGPSEQLRNAMEEALVVAPGFFRDPNQRLSSAVPLFVPPASSLRA